MSTTKRIIPCLDIKDGRTVKGTNFLNLRDAGDPIILAEKYELEGADELVFLDISATENQSKLLVDLVQNLSIKLSIPFTVGGGINSIEKAYNLLQNGADKIAINSAAIMNPTLITSLANEFGSQCITLAIDAKKINGKWKVFSHGGKKSSEKLLFDWVMEVADLGAGEILFTSMDHDGTKNGFALEALKYISTHCSLPLIASGGAGNEQHFLDVFSDANADGALAASVFHYNHISIPLLKRFLSEQNINVRLMPITF